MHKQRAQMVVEFAVIAPLFLLLVVGILGLGRIFYTYIDLTNAARVGARYATAQSGQCAASDLTRKVQDVNPDLKPWPAGASVSPPTTVNVVGGGPGCRVTITYPFDTLVPFFGADRIPPISVSATMPILS
jgi:hypothetical protein